MADDSWSRRSDEQVRRVAFTHSAHYLARDVRAAREEAERRGLSAEAPETEAAPRSDERRSATQTQEGRAEQPPFAGAGRSVETRPWIQSPLSVGFLSIIPGMGQLVLVRFQRAVAVIAAVLFLLWAISSLPEESRIIDFAFMAVVILWISQLIDAVRFARLLQRVDRGTAIAAKHEIHFSAPPTGLSRDEEKAHRCRAIVQQQHRSGEEVIAALSASTDPSAGAGCLLGIFAIFMTKYYYLGLTANHLVLVERDMLGKPFEVKIVDKSNIQSVSVQGRGPMACNLVINWGSGDPLNLRVSKSFRQQAKTIAAAFDTPPSS